MRSIEPNRHRSDWCHPPRRKVMKRIRLAAIALAACLSATPSVAQQKKELALVTNAAADFWTIAKRGVEKAQKEHPDYSMQVIITGQATAAEQRRELDSLLARG